MLIRADARSVPLVDGCVQTIITSPPYWGLRDYGTATWSGGDPACDHRQLFGGEGTASAVQNGNHGSQSRQYRDTCGKCGSQRADSQIGLEPTPDAYVRSILVVFAELWRVLRDDGTVWLNLGDSYSSGSRTTTNEPSAGVGHRAMREGRWRRTPVVEDIKPKDLIGIPWLVAFALRAAGWYLRAEIIWAKQNTMPESVTDRVTRSHEQIFLLAKSPRYYYNGDAIRELNAPSSGQWGETKQRSHGNSESSQQRAPVGGLWRVGSVVDGRNKRSVWSVATIGFPGAHFATFPPALIRPCILAGSRIGDLVFDPFIGSGTVGMVCERYSRRWIGTDLAYQDIATARTAQRGLRFDVDTNTPAPEPEPVELFG